MHSLHEYGINFRFLGLVTAAIHISNMVILLEQEMLARVIKRHLNEKLVAVVLGNAHKAKISHRGLEEGFPKQQNY